mmetsp:Transcript_44166/g.136883  ORF Transcript_44166/g.136883 Transcript_44166/m.136883 type:complete len:252 (-) Transcript_44166:1579-2334(-)
MAQYRDGARARKDGCSLMPRMRRVRGHGRLAHFSPKNMYVGITESGFRETESMPCSMSHLARSGWSEGPWPQMPTYLPLALAALIRVSRPFITAGLRSSKYCATSPESRSKPRVSCVRSLLPMEKPSKYSRNSSARKTLLGSSAIMFTLRPSSPRFRPFFSSTSFTSLAMSRVRTKGIMISTFVMPISPRTFLMASSSMAKHSSKKGSVYLPQPRKPIMGFSSSGSYWSPPTRLLYSLDLKSERRTMMRLG